MASRATRWIIHIILDLDVKDDSHCNFMISCMSCDSMNWATRYHVCHVTEHKEQQRKSVVDESCLMGTVIATMFVTAAPTLTKF